MNDQDLLNNEWSRFIVEDEDLLKMNDQDSP
jgi:hypothetical protein